MSVKCMRNNLMKKFFNMVLSVMIVLLIFPYNTAAETRKEKALAAYQIFWENMNLLLQFWKVILKKKIKKIINIAVNL